MASTRERKIEFIESFGWRVSGVKSAAENCLDKFGPDWFTDEQLEDMCRAHITKWRINLKIRRENRRRIKEQAERERRTNS